jgi:hypothetical protein
MKEKSAVSKETLRQFTKRHASGLLSSKFIETVSLNDGEYLTDEQVLDKIKNFLSALPYDSGQDPQLGHIKDSLNKVYSSLDQS